jgi:hypothetical protein
MKEGAGSALTSPDFDRPDDNPVLKTLNAAGVPWQMPRSELAARFGVRPHPAYQWDVIAIQTDRPIVDGLLYPLSAQVFPQFSPHLPATEFSGVTYFGNDARRNLELTAKQLAGRLGNAKIADRYNTVHCEWNFGAASISLLSWPPDLQRIPMNNNPAHKRDPRLAVGCSIAIKTGFRLKPTAQERVWLKSFVPLHAIDVEPNVTPDSPRTQAAPQGELEFIREPVEGSDRIFGFMGHSADGAALIFCRSELYLVSMERVARFTVDRIQPARGRGGSRLSVECATDYDAVSSKELRIASAAGIDDLNELGAQLAAATNKPCETRSDLYDD